MSGRVYDIFISYSRQDKWLAADICHSLRLAGLTVAFDEDCLGSGDDVGLSVLNMIESAKCVLFLCTPNSVQSNWVKNEVSYCFRIGKKVVPVNLDRTELPADLLILLSTQNVIPLNTDNLASDVAWLVSLVREQCRRPEYFSEGPEPAEEPGGVKPTDRGFLVKPKWTGAPSVPQSASDASESDSRASGGGGSSPDVSSFEPETFDNVSHGGCWWSLIPVVVIAAIVLAIIFVDNSILLGILKWLGIGVGAIVAISLIFVLFKRLPSRKYKFKLYCETEGCEDSTITVKLDGRELPKIKGSGMLMLKEKRGEYMIFVKSDNPDFESVKFSQTFDRSCDNGLKQVTLKRMTPVVAEPAPEPVKVKAAEVKPAETKEPAVKATETTEFKCFIAGSTFLVNERNATRSALSILYNKWKDYNLAISAYTYEDFSNSHMTGGQQLQYDEFIREKATCAIFIVAENIGDETLKEYRLSIETFSNTKTRPKIFVYAHNVGSNSNEVTRRFMDEVRKNQSYWRKYDNIEHLMALIKDDVDSELFNIFIFKNGFNSPGRKS